MGKSSLTLRLEDQPCTPVPPGEHAHHHPTVLFTAASREDQAPARLEVFSRPWYGGSTHTSSSNRIPMLWVASEGPAMGLLHMGHTQRTSSHFTRHLRARDDLFFPKKIPVCSSCLFTEPTCFSGQEPLYPHPGLTPLACLVSRRDEGHHWQRVDGRGRDGRLWKMLPASFFPSHPGTHIPTVHTYLR